MSTGADIYSQALSLPLVQRAELAQKLIDSLRPEDSSSRGASDEELQSRLAEIATGQFEASEWREALARMRTSLAESQSRPG